MRYRPLANDVAYTLLVGREATKEMLTELAGFEMDAHPFRRRNSAPNEARDATVEKEAVVNSRFATYEAEKRRHRNQTRRNRHSVPDL